MKRLAIFVAVSAALSSPSWAYTKLDAALTAVAQKPALAEKVLARAALEKSQFASEPVVKTLLRFEGKGLDNIRAKGAVVHSVSGDIATVDIPVSKVGLIAAQPGVIYIEAARQLRAHLEASVPATHADQIRSGTAPNWTGATGKGVIVGVVDDGLDFRHLDFRNADGTTRLLGLWDQRASGPAGSPPSGFQYGGECTVEMLNKAITEGTSSTACTQPSKGNHGTHVGGIAAGNGQQTGNGQTAYRFVGMAPQADIMAANSIGGGVATSNAVVDGVNYIKQKAAALGKPAVVNLSLGSYYGARDGTSNYEKALTNAGGKGFILVGAAGNESTDKIRAHGSIAQGETVNVGYNIPVDKAQTVEMWYPGTNKYAVKVTGPQADCVTDTINPADPVATKETACGQVVITSTDINPNNDDRQITININPGTSALKQGKWTISITGTVAAAGSTFSMIGADDGNNGVFTDHTDAVTKQILTDTSSATDVIAVGAYVTKTQWNSLNGASTNTNHGPIGDVAAFSSRGPRRDCSNASKCPPIMKPEITAPGAMIMSSLGQDAPRSDNTTIEADGQHVAYNGTSMATPHVSGAIALLLQKDPNLTPADVKRLLFGNVQTNNFTTNLPTFDAAKPMPATPNDAWGYGILDVAKAYNAISGGSSGGGTAKFTASATGDLKTLALVGTITPATADVGKQVYVYLAARLPNGAFFIRHGANWEPLSSPIAPINPNLAPATASMEVPIVSGIDLSGLVGTEIYMGYGASDAEMLQKSTFGKVYTLH